MSWEDRINEAIILTSPSKQLFIAEWRGDSRSLKKKLGKFDYPRVRGAEIQDLDVEAAEYPLTFYFEGPDSDITARKFFEACKERGTWAIIHPVYGELDLQLVSVTEDCQPVESGGLTKFSTEWIEPGVDAPTVSIAEAVAAVAERVAAVEEVAQESFTAAVSMSRMGRLVATVQGVIAMVQKISGRIASIIAVVTYLRNVLVSVLNAVVGSVALLASLVVTLIKLPAAIIKDLGSMFDYYERVLKDSVSELTPDRPDSAGRNTAAVHELVAIACLTGVAEAVVETEFSTREEALAYLERVQGIFGTISTNLDAIQSLYSASTIDEQYISQAGGYTEAALLMQSVIELLLRRTFDLAASRRIMLDRHRTPVEIAITEGMDLDLFISANSLKGDEILLLPPGREVVVYQ